MKQCYHGNFHPQWKDIMDTKTMNALVWKTKKFFKIETRFNHSQLILSKTIFISNCSRKKFLACILMILAIVSSGKTAQTIGMATIFSFAKILLNRFLICCHLQILWYRSSLLLYQACTLSAYFEHESLHVLSCCFTGTINQDRKMEEGSKW